jgi:hypothetical protein
MSGGVSYTFADMLLNHILRGSALTLPSNFYLRLLTTATSKGIVGVETAYGAYARKLLLRDTTVFSASSGDGESSNAVVLEFPQATTTGSGDLRGFDIVDTASGVFTMVYLWGLITPARAVVVGKKVRFPAGSLIVTA